MTTVADAVRLAAIHIGRAVPYTRPGSCSAIAKSAVAHAVTVHAEGIEGDEQGDRRVHGGPDKAIHHYPRDHYDFWRAQHPHALLQDSGAFGENFSSSGWTEQEIHLADVIQVGTAVLQVSQGRQPCWKLNDRFGYTDMARTMQSSGKTGWYYRVLQPGQVAPGDVMVVAERPCPAWPLARLASVMFDRTLDRALLQEATLLPLTPSWKKLLEHRLQSNQVESWAGRLDGPTQR